MLRLSKRIPQGQGLAAALLRRAPSLALDWATRQKSRFDARLSNDEHVGVFLPRGHVLRGGDVLVAEDGRLVRVVAADEAVTVVSAPAMLNPAEAAHALMRGAYHLGNRHVMLSLQSGRLVMEPDPVLGEMLKGLGLEVREAREPLSPKAALMATTAADTSMGMDTAITTTAATTPTTTPQGPCQRRPHTHDRPHAHDAPDVAGQPDLAGGRLQLF
ncbi:urease accessory protein UreE [Ideonella paludis]|uniref:urease accessory protein UreE n=1 Tax=Ideonella paludis TaxID=1233411 RepID=UPI0036330505